MKGKALHRIQIKGGLVGEKECKDRPIGYPGIRHVTRQPIERRRKCRNGWGVPLGKRSTL